MSQDIISRDKNGDGGFLLFVELNYDPFAFRELTANAIVRTPIVLPEGARYYRTSRGRMIFYKEAPEDGHGYHEIPELNGSGVVAVGVMERRWGNEYSFKPLDRGYKTKAKEWMRSHSKSRSKPKKR